MSTPQQVIFVGKVEEDNVATNVFYCWKATRFFFKFFCWFTNCNRIILIMEHQKILNLLNEANDSKFLTRE